MSGGRPGARGFLDAKNTASILPLVMILSWDNSPLLVDAGDHGAVCVGVS